MVVRAARYYGKTPVKKSLAQSLGIVDYILCISFKGRIKGFLEADSLAGNDML